jgi:glutamate/tyrosine decarboxylase-like PLP-dependent enzyme
VDPRLAEDLAGLPGLLDATRKFAERALAGLDSRPVAGLVRPAAAEPLPQQGIGLAGALERFAERWEPGFSGSAGPRYLGFVTGGATPAALAGDWLTSAYDQNVVFEADSSATELERETLGWLRELFGLDSAFRGAFVSGATTSNFVGLAIAREWLGEWAGISVAHAGVAALGEAPVLSGSPHSSIYKALSMTGIGRDRMRTVPVLAGREAVDVGALSAALSSLDGRPAIVVGNAGTVNTVDFDDLRAIAALKDRYPFWFHVDAAFGGFAALSPEHAALLDGVAAADSVCVDLHKWLNVPYDAAVQFSRRPDLQVAVFQNSAPYLSVPTDNPDFVHLTPESSRRLRALATWFSLAAYGRDGHAEIVRRDVELARLLGSRLAELPAVRLLAPVRMNVVCFTFDGDVSAAARAIAETGETFVTPTVYAGQPALRAALSNWRTTESDVDRMVAAIERVVAGF